jgi:hypothetical protein
MTRPFAIFAALAMLVTALSGCVLNENAKSAEEPQKSEKAAYSETYIFENSFIGGWEGGKGDGTFPVKQDGAVRILAEMTYTDQLPVDSNSYTRIRDPSGTNYDSEKDGGGHERIEITNKEAMEKSSGDWDVYMRVAGLVAEVNYRISVMVFYNAVDIASGDSAGGESENRAGISFFTKDLPHSPSAGVGDGFEPHILAAPGIDGNEWYYIDSPTGTTTGGNLWVSGDSGETWECMSHGVGGTSIGFSGDSYTAVSSKGYIYYSDLYLATATVDASKDGGAMWVQNPAASVYPIVDRQWLIIGPTVGGLPVSPPETIYFMYNQAEGLFMVKSYVTEDALVWTPCNSGLPITTNMGFRDYFAVDQKSGMLYLPNTENGGIVVYVSSDGGATFSKYSVSSSGGQNLFVVADVDAGGNAYVSWSDQSDVYLAVSKDSGKEWKIHKVMDTKGTRVFPWIAAGDAGRIGLTWYETADEGDPNELDGSNWSTMAAISTNAISDDVMFYITTVEGNIHTGAIDTVGSGGTADRDLGDFFTCDVDKKGRLVLVYGKDGNDGAYAYKAKATFARQREGPFLMNGTGPISEFAYAIEGLTIYADASESSSPNGEIMEYAWEWGDGSSSTGREVNHIYNKSGEYTVTLTAVDKEDMANGISKDIELLYVKGTLATSGFEFIVPIVAAGAVLALTGGKKRRR